MGEGTQRPTGERRRRREAARAAEHAAGQSGRPLTRRELRRREAEEAARLEAIATGELQVVEVQRDAGSPAPTAPAESASDAPRSGVSAAGPAASPASGSSVTAVSGSTASPTSPATPATSAAAAERRPPSRRSLRERAATASRETEAPQERTATGRRPVVRTPSTAQGIRVIDATGQLTAIQPVARPDAPDAAQSQYFSIELDGPAQADRRAMDAPAESLVARSLSEPGYPAPADEPGHEPLLDRTDRPAAGRAATDDQPSVREAQPDTVARPEQPEPAPVAAEPSPAGEPAPPVEAQEFTLRPRWVAISSVSGASPEDAGVQQPRRRSTRAEPSAEGDAPDRPEPRNPALTLVKIAVLALVAVVLGALIWVLSTDPFDDDAAAPTATATVTIYEESRVR